MIDLYYWPTPNGWKISIALEELGLPYTVQPVNIGRGAQFEPAFLAISPNNRIPALVDHDPPGGGAPFSSFETGAMLVYLAEKSGRLLPSGQDHWRGRHTVLPWLMWQMGGLGPMLGQHGHFRLYASEKIPYAIDRYERETRRLYGVLDTQLAKTGAFVAGADYGIAEAHFRLDFAQVMDRVAQVVREVHGGHATGAEFALHAVAVGQGFAQARQDLGGFTHRRVPRCPRDP